MERLAETLGFPEHQYIAVRHDDTDHEHIHVAMWPHGNGLVFEDVERGVRVKASFVARELNKTRLCERIGAFQSVSERQREAAQRAPHRYSQMPARASQSLWKEYEQTLQEARARRERDWARYRHTAAGE